MTMIMTGWLVGLVHQARSERGLTIEQVLWAIFWIGAVGVVSAAVMTYLHTQVAKIG